jgi:hypothetical protein
VLLTGTSIEKSEAQFGKFDCPDGQKKTELGPFKDQGNKRLKLWCIGTDDKRNTTNPKVAFIATEIVMTMNDGTKMSTWIHRCGFKNGDNQWTDREDLTKKVEAVNIKPDGSRIEYVYDVENGKLTITTKDSRGMVIDTRMVEKKDLNNPLDVPHPGDDLNYNTSIENIEQLPGCFFIVDGDDLEFNLVGGEILQIDNTAFLLAGISQSAAWMIPTLAGLAGAGVYLVKFRTNKE